MDAVSVREVAKKYIIPIVFAFLVAYFIESYYINRDGKFIDAIAEGLKYVYKMFSW